MLETLDNIDRILFLYFNGMHGECSDHFWQVATNIPTWVPLYLLILIAFIWYYRADSVWVILCALLVILLSDQFTSAFMKPFFGRLRPCHEPGFNSLVHVVKQCGGRYGFASGHAANSFGIATFTWLMFRYRSRLVQLIFIWAALVAFSRIMVGVHYPGDIIVGALVGAFFGWFVYRLLATIYFKINIQPLVKD